VEVAVQQRPLGTGDAVRSAREALSDADEVLVLSGDTPLLTTELLDGLLGTHRASGAAATVLSFFPDDILKATVANATAASLTGTDEIKGAKLGFPFPIPQTGAEPLWNHKLKFRGSAVKRFNNQAIVKPDGTYKISKLVEDVKFKYANLKEPAEVQAGGLFAYYLQEVLEPPRVAGQVILVHETAGNPGLTRNAWIYSPGLARVNRAPDVGYDNPSIGSDGEQFNDQIDVFNGALDRFDWKLVGKKDVLIQYISWMLNSPTFKYKDVIRPGHING
jgi:hypothetical protein